MSTEDLTQLQYLYEHYSLEIDIAQRQLITLHNILHSVNNVEMNEFTKEDIQVPIKMNMAVAKTKIDFCMAARRYILEKLQLRSAFSYTKFDKIEIKLALN